MDTNNEGYVFGLDIGTRSIVGTVGYRVGVDRFIVVALESIEHSTRAVIDGQIHDISTVARTIREIKDRLENRINCELREASIAAAGRVLKTSRVHAVMDFPTETKVTSDHINSLDMMGVEMAYEEIRKDTAEDEKKFYCVGYSAAKYYLNGYPMEMLAMHSANSIGVDLIGTFLPEEVVDGLYEAVEEANLKVASLTLEPIAAIQIAIPEKFRLLNIALVDVGAGTSDISVVKDGSIIAFGMIPLAGDELTEAIAQHYLTDFETAEFVKRQCERKKQVSFKNIFGETIQVDQEEIMEVTQDAVNEITKLVSDEIIGLNGGKTVSAVFVVGGGGKHAGFTQKLAEYLGLPENRVAIRGAEVLADIRFEQAGIPKDSTLVTPIGICMNYYEQKNNFIHVMVNDQGVKLYDNGKATVLDACIASGFSQNNLFPIRGEELRYTVNGEERVVKGKAGEVAEVRKNGNEVSLNEPARQNDQITIRPSTKGKDGRMVLGDIPECKAKIKFTVYGKKLRCPSITEVNGLPVSPRYEVQNGDRIEVFDYYSVAGLLEYAGEMPQETVLLNGREAGSSAKVYDGDVIERKLKPKHRPKERLRGKEKPAAPAPSVPPAPEKDDFQKQMENDPLLQPVKPLPEWMKGIPFSTAKTIADSSPSGTPAGNRAEPVKTEKPENMETAGSKTAGKGENPGKPGKAVEVFINGDVYTMPDKPDPIFVDVFDIYPFDLSKPGGTRLVSKINGEEKAFTEPVHEGDEIELYWEK